jgi:polygalacturonase
LNAAEVRIVALLLSAGVAVLPLRATESGDPCQPPNFRLPTFGGEKVNVRDFGAVGNGTTNDTDAINHAIEKCTAGGGGDVVFPPGTYAAASIHLKSNIRFVLDDKATITGAKAGYDPPEPNPFEKYQDFGHSHFHNALMWGDNVENFGIFGGHVNGGALIEGEPNGRDIGDKLISITRGRNLQFENITHQTGAHFVYLLNDCENVTIANVTVQKSRDAVNLVSCRNVQIHNCKFTGCGDDTVALKSDYALGRKINSENIYVWDCYLETAANALQFGAETIGDFRNINFWNIRIGRAWKAAIGIKCSGGAVIDSVNYRDITIKDAACPILFRVTDGLHSVTPNKTPGAIKNVRIANVTATDCKSSDDGRPRTCFIAGRPDSPVENVNIENVRIVFSGGAGGQAVPAEPRDLDTNRVLTGLPAAGLYVRHAKDLKLKDMTLEFGRSDSRPAIAAFDVDGLELSRVKLQKIDSAEKLRMEKIQRLTVRDCDGLRDRSGETIQSILKE